MFSELVVGPGGHVSIQLVLKHFRFFVSYTVNKNFHHVIREFICAYIFSCLKLQTCTKIIDEEKRENKLI